MIYKLVCAGDNHFIDLYKKDENEIIIAVDGGYKVLNENNIKIDYFFGDYDSLGTNDIECVKKFVPLSCDCEISCELNPECLTESKMSVLNEFATRLSLGVQSFDPHVRSKLMRRCSEEHLLRALKLLRKRRMKHFNIDLLFLSIVVSRHVV